MTNANETSALWNSFADVRAKWGWFIALGFFFVAAGAVAASNLLVATIATVYYVGALMIVASVMQIIQSFQIKTWGGFLLWILSGILYAIAGVMTFINPLLASFALTLLLAVFIGASGVFRIWLGYQSKSEKGWGWIVASGIVTFIAGIIFIIGWPTNSLWLLGLLLAIDLIFQGCALVAFGLHLRAKSDKVSQPA